MLSGHAYVLAGGYKDVESVLALLRGEGIATEKNPDLYIRRYGQFGIDDARQLSERAALRALKDRRVFLLVVDSINAEAQNALLKTLEEPPGGALFFFLHPAPETLLPTVRSRVQILTLENGTNDASIDVAVFLKASPSKRLNMLEPLLEKGEDDRRDIGDILAFLSALEKQLQRTPSSLHAVYRARRYIGDRGALVKPLLEEVALLI